MMRGVFIVGDSDGGKSSRLGDYDKSNSNLKALGCRWAEREIRGCFQAEQISLVFYLLSSPTPSQVEE